MSESIEEMLQRWEEEPTPQLSLQLAEEYRRQGRLEEGTTILKFYLHIDQDEQKERLQARLDEPHKRWKFNPGDLDDRRLWHDFQRAYEDALMRCNTDWAPWYVVPADRKWYRNLIVSRILLEVMESMAPAYPEPVADPMSYQIPEV